MPPPPSLPTSSIASNTFAVPSISPLSRFADLSLRSPAINSLVSNSPAVQQHPPLETSSPTPEKMTAQVQANDKLSSVSPSAAERWSPLRRTVPAKDVSPAPSSDPEPARMEMDDQTTPATPVGVDPPDELPPPTTTDSEDVPMVTSSPSFAEPPPISSTSIVSDSSSSLDVPTERPPSPASIPSTPPPPSPPAATVEAVIVSPPLPVEVVIPECPPASALFDDELLQDEDVHMLSEDEVVKEISEPKPASSSSHLPSTDAEIRESAPLSSLSPSVEPRTVPESPLPPVPHPPSSPSPPPSPVVEHVIPERAATPTFIRY